MKSNVSGRRRFNPGVFDPQNLNISTEFAAFCDPTSSPPADHERQIATLDAELRAMHDELRAMRGEGEITIHSAQHYSRRTSTTRIATPRKLKFNRAHRQSRDSPSSFL